MEVAAGDVVKVLDSGAGTFELVRRGGNVCVQFYLSEEESGDAAAAKEEAAAIGDALQPLGGWIDRVVPGLIAFSVSVSVGFAAIEELAIAAVARRPGAQWQYANVYDPVSGEPLGWWEQVFRWSRLDHYPWCARPAPW